MAATYDVVLCSTMAIDSTASLVDRDIADRVRNLKAK